MVPSSWSCWHCHVHPPGNPTLPQRSLCVSPLPTWAAPGSARCPGTGCSNLAVESVNKTFRSIPGAVCRFFHILPLSVVCTHVHVTSGHLHGISVSLSLTGSAVLSIRDHRTPPRALNGGWDRWLLQERDGSHAPAPPLPGGHQESSKQGPDTPLPSKAIQLHGGTDCKGNPNTTAGISLGFLPGWGRESTLAFLSQTKETRGCGSCRAHQNTTGISPGVADTAGWNRTSPLRTSCASPPQGSRQSRTGKAFPTGQNHFSCTTFRRVRGTDSR